MARPFESSRALRSARGKREAGDDKRGDDAGSNPHPCVGPGDEAVAAGGGEVRAMGSVAAEVQAKHYRRPWYWLVALGVAAIAASFFVMWNARSRIALSDRQFEAMQMLRLEQMKQRIDDYFLNAKQLAVLCSQTLGNVHGDSALLRTLTLETFRGHRDPDLYGLGVFFAPYMFDAHEELVNDYVHSGSQRYTPFDRMLGSGVVEVYYATNRPDRETNYVTQEWYRTAVASRGKINIDGPYTEDGRNFISVVQAFYRGGHVAGVISVDTLESWYKAMMTTVVAHGDIAWLQIGRNGGYRLGTSSLPKGEASRIDRSVPLRDSRAILHLSSDASGLFASNRQDVIAAVLLIAAIWGLAAIVALLLLQRWQAYEEAIELELRQGRLENEIELAQTVASELRKAAYTDALTGLPNRAAFLERADDVLSQAGNGVGHAILFIDLDRFNVINETLGHLAGDELLRLIALRLAGEAPGDMLATLGGDEFVIIAHGDEHAARKKAERAMELIAQPLVLGGRNIRPHASIGITFVGTAYAKPDDLLRDAGIAVNEAKRRGRQRIVVFDAAMRRQAAEDAELETSLRHAIERRELVPYYQPIVNIATGAIASFEALVRWNHPGRGIVEAGQFMQFAESHALVHEVDSLVLPQVVGHCTTLFGLIPEASVAVNLSAAELSDRDLAGRIETLLAEHKISPSRLKLEITETSMMMPSDEATANLEQLRGIGVQLVLDDFGTGYSSLAYLQRLPVVGLKIDRSFVEHITRDPRIEELVRNIVALAHTFSLYTVAEGVENREQLNILTKIGVAFAQGYLYSPAVDIAAVAGLLRRIDQRQ
ncbi:MAG: EAL domain-containing protein [Candidatus Aquilonibacter sp.]